jgi:Na+-driven multidrug efflux pump
LLHTHPAIVRNAIRYASPVLFNEMIWTSGSMVIASVLGHMGREVVAANSICSILFQFTQVAIFGLSSSALTIIGNTIGEGQYDAAKRRARAFIWLSGLFGVIASFVMFFSRFALIEFYRLSELARSNAYQMSSAASALVILQSIALVLMMGVLRGGGDTRFVMVTDVLFIWMICIPLGAFAGLVWHLPVAVVYLLLKGEDVFKTFVAVYRVNSGRWLRDLTR